MHAVVAALLQALFASALTGGGFTGAALNPARVLGECYYLLLTVVTNSYVSAQASCVCTDSRHTYRVLFA
jgi:glycerol uptake facilitator-like aquaporin